MTVFPSSPSQSPFPWQDLSDPLWWDEPFPDRPDLSLEETELAAPETTAPRSGVSKPAEDLVHQVAAGCLEANPSPRPSSAVQTNDDSLSSIASPEMISVLSCTDVGGQGCVNSVAENSLQFTFQLPPICEAVSLGTRVGRYQFIIKLGAAYQSGIEGIKDSEKAVNSFLQAGGLGSLEQLYKLGMVCLAGIGCVQDPKLALTIFSAGADLGDPACRDMYQRCCAHGVGVTAVPQATLQSSLNVQTNDNSLSRIASPPTIPVLSCADDVAENSSTKRQRPKKRKVEKIPSSASPVNCDLQFISYIIPLCISWH